MTREEIIQHVKKFKKDNQHKYHIKKMGIFGSLAKNSLDEPGDVDIVVDLTKQDLFALIGIKQDLEEILNYQVDVISYREKMNAFLKKRIDDEAIYV